MEEQVYVGMHVLVCLCAAMCLYLHMLGNSNESENIKT